MSSVTESVGGNVSTSAPTLDLHEIQATVLRPRPAPYFGTHVLLRIDDARAGREFIRRLAPHIASADELVECGDGLAGDRNQLCGPRGARASEGIAAKLSRGVSCRHGRACTAAWRRWASTIRRTGTSRSARVKSISASVHSAIPRKSGGAPSRSLASSTRASRASASCALQDFGAQPGDLNSLGYKDGIDQPTIEGSGVEPLPGQGRPIKAGEFILGYPGEAGIPLPMPQPEHTRPQRHLLRRFANIRLASARSIDSFARMEAPRRNGNCSPQSWSAVGAAAHR